MQPVYRQIQPRGRLIAISDIHGRLDMLERILEKTAFSSADTLVIDGDLIERGPDSLGVVRKVLQLMKGGNVFSTLGNVDLQIVRAVFENRFLYGGSLQEYLSWQKGSVVLQMLREIAPEFEPGDDPSPLLPAVREQFHAEWELLANAPAMLRAGKFLFVHGGLTNPDPEICAQGDAWSLLKNDCYLDHACRSERWQVVGHWPVTLYRSAYPDCSPVIDREKKVICIDGGCGIKPFSQLNALIIPDIEQEDFSFAWANTLPVFVSPFKQSAGERSVFIKWPDNYVHILEQTEFLSYIEHPASGAKLWVPTEYLWGDEDETRVDDVTDYLLPVEKGEAVYLVKKLPGRFLCKKEDGRVGWIMEA